MQRAEAIIKYAVGRSAVVYKGLSTIKPRIHPCTKFAECLLL